MTFAALHQSNTQSRPVSLFLLTWGNSQWSYTSADRTIPHDGIDYLPQAIEESSLRHGGNEVPEFTITVPVSLEVVGLFRGTPPSTRVNLTVRHFHPNDPDEESVIRWIGPVTNVRPLDSVKAEIVSRVNGLKRAGARLSYGRGCKYALYGPGCKVDKTAYAHARTVTAVDGNTVTLSADTPSAGYFNGGLIEWDIDGNGTIESRTIERETSASAIQLYGRGDGISLGMAVTLYPGCPRTAEACDTKFDNLPNYPGFDFMRGESPFDGRALL